MHNAENFDRLWNEAFPSVRRTVARYGRGLASEDREDAEVRARLRAWRSFPQYDPSRCSFVTWASMIARCETLDVCRQATSVKTAHVERLSENGWDTLFEEVSDHAPSPLDRVLAQEEGAEIEVLLRNLTLRQGRALRLVAGGMSFREAGAAMGVSAQNAAHAVQEARHQIARAIAVA